MFLCDSYVIVSVVLLVGIVYAFYKHAHGYWARRNVPFLPPSFPFGNMSQVMLRRQNFTDQLGEFYTWAKSKGHLYMGLYFFTRQALLVVDPGLIKRVLSTEFPHFHDRTLTYDEKNEPLTAHLVALRGQKWKHLRSKLTPTFSSGKLKAMFDTVLECGQELVRVLRRHDAGAIEMKDLMSRYTTDVIGSCAFGISCNSLANPDAEFRRVGRAIFEPKAGDVLKRIIQRSSPWLWRALRLKQIDSEVSAFFINAVRETVDYRRESQVTRNDFLQLLIELMRDGRTSTGPKNEREDGQTPLTINEVAAQAFVFFLAGYETSASTITFALFELAMRPQIQEEARQEVSRILQKHRGKLTYDALMEMHFMDKVIFETLRKYPSFTLIVRKCTKSYTIPETGAVIQEGTPVFIPIYALHHDPDYYPDPESFDPNRFESEATKTRIDHTYLPFGDGPRICIGMRFAMIQVKIALAVLLTNFEFMLNNKTKVPLQKDKNTFILSSEGGIWLDLKKISNE